VNDQRVGLIEGRIGDPRSALDCYDQAIELAPSTARYHVRRGVVLASMEQYDAAIATLDRAIQLDPSSAAAAFEHGRVVAAKAARRGAFSDSELASVHASWRTTLAIDPDHQSARYHLVRSLVSDAQWSAAAMSALAPSGADGLPEDLSAVWKDDDDVDVPAALSSVRAWLRRTTIPHDLTTDWWYVLYARVHALGAFVLAHEVKSALARRVATRSSPLWRVGVTGYLDVARALSYLGDDAAAIAHLRSARWHGLPHHEQSAFVKLLADLELLRGDPTHATSALDLHGRVNSEVGARRFADLVTGRRVAIVGPGASNAANGAEIDAFDTVVRTKFRRSPSADAAVLSGSRTDISYYSDSNSRLLTDDIARLLAAGSLGMAVFRPTRYDPAIRCIHHEGDLRYMPSQDSSTFEATRFAVQRIVYDLVRYRPAELKLFNIDFFLSENAYADGYTDEASDVFAARNLRLIRTSAAHDLALDFDFVRRLVGYGLLEVDDRIGRLIRMTPLEYLAELERARGGPPRF
jgi:tetratricopeptide (TPR) repeat protein